MEFGRSILLRRSESSSAGDRPRIGFRRTVPLVSMCHPNWRGHDASIGFPSRTDSPRLTGGTGTGIFDVHHPSTYVREAQGVLVRNRPRIFDRQLVCEAILSEELLLYAANVSSCQFVIFELRIRHSKLATMPVATVPEL